MNQPPQRFVLCFAVALASSLLGADEAPLDPAFTPSEATPLFNGRDLTGFYPWVEKAGREDPQGVFSVEEGMIRILGQPMGYLATEKAYCDYHLVVEYRWGKKTDGTNIVRNAGVLLHGAGPDGAAGGRCRASRFRWLRGASAT